MHSTILKRATERVIRLTCVLALGGRRRTALYSAPVQGRRIDDAFVRPHADRHRLGATDGPLRLSARVGQSARCELARVLLTRRYVGNSD
jgi:hypothetical protein